MTGFSSHVAGAHRVPLVVGALLLVASALFVPAAQAQGQDSPDEVVIFVLDLSGSMNEPFDGTRTKLDAAKAAFVEAFTNVSPDALVGLRTYGDQIPTTEPDARGPSCSSDSRQTSAVAPLERDQLIRQVQGFAALGDTPMSLALERASEDVPAGAVGTIVLFSDGRDECFDADLDGDAATGPSYGEDPCRVAQALAEEPAVHRVMTVGFGADDAAQAELRCIAESTGGIYTAIETPEDAQDILPELLVQLSAPRQAQQLIGRAIVGTTSADGAPELERLTILGAEQVLYTDEITAGEEKWYHVDQYGPKAGTFTATVFGLPAEANISFGMRAVAPGLNDQTFFSEHGDDDAGLPGRQTSSIRCTDCLISNGPHEVYWVVSLHGPDMADTTYPLEIVTSGPGFGGPPTSCSEPQECWYPIPIADRVAAIAQMEATIAEVSGEQAPPGLIESRNMLVSKTEESQRSVENANTRAEDLEALIAEAPAQTSSFKIPLLMILAGVGLALIPGSKLPRRSRNDLRDNGGIADPNGKPNEKVDTTPAKDQPLSRRNRRRAKHATDQTSPLTPPGVSLPVATVSGRRDKWDVELEAAKAALAQQREPERSVDQPTQLTKKEVAASQAVESMLLPGDQTAARPDSRESAGHEEGQRLFMTETLAARKDAAADAPAPRRATSPELEAPAPQATTPPIALGAAAATIQSETAAQQVDGQP